MTNLTDPGQYLSIELQRLDLLLHREILRLRAGYQLSLDEFRGLYISDEQVDRLIDRALNYDGATSLTEELTARSEALRASESGGCDDSPWSILARNFSLSQFEQDILLLAVALEIDLKYETLYAYLNNDVTRKWPTRDLALRLLTTNADQKTHVRASLRPDSPLFASGLLRLITSTPERPSWLASGYTVAQSVLHYLSGYAYVDPRSSSFVEPRKPAVGWEEVSLTPEQRAALQRIPVLCSHNRTVPLIIFTGREGSGRGIAAEAVCSELGCMMLIVDLAGLRSSAEDVDELMRMIFLQQRLQGAGLYLEGCEALFDKEGRPLPDAARFIKSLAQAKSPVFFAFESTAQWRELMTGQRSVCFRFEDPDYAARLQLWEKALAQIDASICRPVLETLADRFILTPTQIVLAVESAVDARTLSDRSLDSASFFEAAREQSDQNLGNLSVKMKTIHTWEDLILPRATLQCVKEVAAAIKYRHIVYSDWGFEQRIATGKGLKALFAGGSGTGKTMTAGVIARELGLELYKIDLSAIVSKYIGETEKNLDRIFRAAQYGNAILLFDEADALFGKRSEVKDAHDRYANVEVAYLLQKIEEYEGVVILASNLSKNIDDAFSRRMHYVVEFPLPDDKHREQLWRCMFPERVPLGRDVDFQFVAQQFSISGGDIRNVALDAAFLAAQDGQVVTMRQLVRALARQMMKRGRPPSPSDFKQYHELIAQFD